MSVVIESEGGDALGYRRAIASDGAGRTYPGDSTVDTFEFLVDNLSAMVLLARRAGRRAVQIQNKDDTGILYIRLDDVVPATPSDLQVYPGGIYEFPSSVSWEGQISGLSNVAALPVVVLEFYLVPEAGTM